MEVEGVKRMIYMKRVPSMMPDLLFFFSFLLGIEKLHYDKFSLFCLSPSK